MTNNMLSSTNLYHNCKSCKLGQHRHCLITVSHPEHRKNCPCQNCIVMLTCSKQCETRYKYYDLVSVKIYEKNKNGKTT